MIHFGRGRVAKIPVYSIEQSAVIPFITKKGITEIVLITSSSNKNWVIPKGGIEKWMTPEKSAAKEALEEAGVVGVVSRTMVAEYECTKYGSPCHVGVYPLAVSKVLARWEEMNKRNRRIVAVDKAIKIIKKEQKAVLKTFQDMIHTL